MLWPNLNSAGYFTTDGVATEYASAIGATEDWWIFAAYRRLSGTGTGWLNTLCQSGQPDGFFRHYLNDPSVTSTNGFSDAGASITFNNWGDVSDDLDFLLVEHKYSTLYTVGITTSQGDQGTAVDTYTAAQADTAIDWCTWGAYRLNGAVSGYSDLFMLGAAMGRGDVLSAGEKTSLISAFGSGSLLGRVTGALGVLETALGSAVKFSQCFARNRPARVGTAAVEGGTISWEPLAA